MSGQICARPNDLDWYLHKKHSLVLRIEAEEVYGLTFADRSGLRENICIARKGDRVWLVMGSSTMRWELPREFIKALDKSHWIALLTLLDPARFWSLPEVRLEQLEDEHWTVEGRMEDAYYWLARVPFRLGVWGELAALFHKSAGSEMPTAATPMPSLYEAARYFRCPQDAERILEKEFHEVRRKSVSSYNPLESIHHRFRFSWVSSTVMQTPAEETYGFKVDGAGGGRYRVCIARHGDRITLIGACHSRHFGSECEGRRSLTMGDWQRLQDALDGARFWDLSKRIERYGLDGEDWTIEGRRGEIYHSSECWVPDAGAYRAVGELFVELFGVPIREIWI